MTKTFIKLIESRKLLIFPPFMDGIAIFVAGIIVPGIEVPGRMVGFLLMLLIFEIVNLFLLPILNFLCKPIILLTLGSFSLVLNALILLITSWICLISNLDFIINSFVSAIIGALILTLFQTIANKLMLKYKIKETGNTENEWIYELGKRINWLEEQRNNLRCQIEKRKATIREQGYANG